MDRAAIETAVRKAMAEATGCEPDRVDLTQTPFELGIDSLTRLEALMQIEDELQIDIPDSGLSDRQSLNDLIDDICNPKGEQQ